MTNRQIKLMFNITNYQRKANQNYNEISPHTAEWPSSKSLQKVNAGDGVEKRVQLAGRNEGENWCSHY